MTKKNKEINYGKSDVIDSDLGIKKSKIRITTMIDYAVYEALKKEAQSQDLGYQTLINEILNAYAEYEDYRQMINVKKWHKSMLGKVLESIKKRLSKIEKEVEEG